MRLLTAQTTLILLSTLLTPTLASADPSQTTTITSTSTLTIFKTLVSASTTITQTLSSGVPITVIGNETLIIVPSGTTFFETTMTAAATGSMATAASSGSGSGNESGGAALAAATGTSSAPVNEATLAPYTFLGAAAPGRGDVGVGKVLVVAAVGGVLAAVGLS
ncbi:hypothetical protein MMC25_001935 [Agyrium rufum]|nr:hypothetical protein [Agyrium rufum]